MVISGEIEGRQLDEFSVNGPTTVVEFYQQHGISNSVFASEDLVSGRWTLDSLSGGSAADNAVLIERILTGREAGARLEAVLLNSAAALLVSGRVRSMSEGWERARLLVASGKVWEKVESLRKAIPAGIR
jgi:anthranilate phosphoribosyltransferase